LLAAAAAGYVLGARAGRQRYEQLKAGAQRVSRNPRVQSVAHKAQDAAAQQASAVAEAAKDLTKQGVAAATDKVRGHDDHHQIGTQATP
jgi:hypothetical protein